MPPHVSLLIRPLARLCALVLLAGSASGCLSFAVHTTVTGVYPIEEAHVVLATASDGLYRSTEDGRRWVHTAPWPVTELLTSANGPIWGYYGWQDPYKIGAGEAYLLYSADSGRSWSRLELDARRVFPLALLQDADGRPHLLAADGQLWAPCAGCDQARWANWRPASAPLCSATSSGDVRTGLSDPLYALVDEMLYIAAYLPSQGRYQIISCRLQPPYDRINRDLDGPVLAFLQGEASCWAITASTTLVTPCGRADWVERAVGAPDGSRMHVVATRRSAMVDGRRLCYGDVAVFVACRTADGSVFTLANPQTKRKTVVALRQAEDGGLWAVDLDGLWRYADQRWTLVLKTR